MNIVTYSAVLIVKSKNKHWLNKYNRITLPKFVMFIWTI